MAGDTLSLPHGSFPADTDPHPAPLAVAVEGPQSTEFDTVLKNGPIRFPENAENKSAGAWAFRQPGAEIDIAGRSRQHDLLSGYKRELLVFDEEGGVLLINGNEISSIDRVEQLRGLTLGHIRRTFGKREKWAAHGLEKLPFHGAGGDDRNIVIGEPWSYHASESRTRPEAPYNSIPPVQEVLMLRGYLKEGRGREFPESDTPDPFETAKRINEAFDKATHGDGKDDDIFLADIPPISYRQNAVVASRAAAVAVQASAGRPEGKHQTGDSYMPLGSAQREEILAKAELHGTYSDYEGDVGDLRLSAEDLRSHGLEPKYEVQLGDVIIHFSDSYPLPFGDGDHAAVVGYVETPDGNVVARTYYLSGSQALWRYLPAWAPGWLDKGHTEDSLLVPDEAQVALSDISSGQQAADPPQYIVMSTARMSEKVPDVGEGQGAQTYNMRVDSRPVLLEELLLAYRAAVKGCLTARAGSI